MGAVDFSIDPELVGFLAGHLPLDTFFETGTYKGDAIERVKPFFKRFYSAELSRHYYEFASDRFREDPAVAILEGDAADMLAEVLPTISAGGILFWLDSHWCEAENTEGKTSQCSLLSELRAIGELDESSIILIDDARLFLAPPGPPHDYSQWPDLNAIIKHLSEISGAHELIVFNDLIIYYPQAIRSAMLRYCHINGTDWLTVMDVYREADVYRREMTEKEGEISACHKEIKILQSDIAAKEREIELNARDIRDIQCTADHRLFVINQFEAAKDEIRSGYQNQLDLLQNLVEEKNARIASLSALAETKEKQIADANAIAESRLQVIEQQAEAIRAYQQKSGLFEKLRRRLEPRLGTLYQYPPRPMKLPARYTETRNRIKIRGDFPVISIATPSFNHAGFLERTLRSVVSQAYPALEYMIQDGGSTDGTIDILETYTDQLAGWVSEADDGQADAINKCLQRATGDVMAYLNSDDLLLPGALHYVAAFFDRHPEVDVVYGHRILIDEYDQEIGRWVLPPHDDQVLSWADYIPQETLFWRKSIWEKTGGYVDKKFKFAMDWDLILRFRDAGARFVRLPRFLGAFRVHPHQKTSAEIAEQGENEMGQLRQRALGRPVSTGEINLKIRPYLRRHVILNKLFRAGILRY
jgi:hypothetical protein